MTLFLSVLLFRFLAAEELRERVEAEEAMTSTSMTRTKPRAATIFGLLQDFQ